MNKVMKANLQRLKFSEIQYGYLALKDYKKFYYLSSLNKIIKIKETNRILCTKRKQLEALLADKDRDTIQIVIEMYKLSEQIGKNGHKIQRLRTKYSQYGEKWLQNKIKPKHSDGICYQVREYMKECTDMNMFI